MYRPAWRISQTGVRSTCSPRAARTRISRSPALLVASSSWTTAAAASVVEWMQDDDDNNERG